MRDPTTAASDSAAGLKGAVPWRVIHVEALSHSSLAVRFADGTQGQVDMSSLLAASSPGVFAALRDPTLFGQVRVEHGAVTWPGDIDLAPDAMYDDIRQTGRSIPR